MHFLVVYLTCAHKCCNSASGKYAAFVWGACRSPSASGILLPCIEYVGFKSFSYRMLSLLLRLHLCIFRLFYFS